MAVHDPYDAMMGGRSVRTAKFDEVGDFVEGVILESEMLHAREYIEGEPGKGDLLYWSVRGRPCTKRPEPCAESDKVWEPRVILQTTLRDDDMDDGRRSVTFNKPRQKASLRKAVLAAGAERPEAGGLVRQTRTADEPPTKGENWARGWSHLYRTPEQYAALGAFEAMVSTKGTKKAGPPHPVGGDDDPWA